MAKTVTMIFVTSDERKREVQAAADALETTMSAWLREAVREKLERQARATAWLYKQAGGLGPWQPDITSGRQQ